MTRTVSYDELRRIEAAGGKVTLRPMQVTPSITIEDLSALVDAVKLPAPVVHVSVPDHAEELGAIRAVLERVASQPRPVVNVPAPVPAKPVPWEVEVTSHDRAGRIRSLRLRPLKEEAT